MAGKLAPGGLEDGRHRRPDLRSRSGNVLYKDGLSVSCTGRSGGMLPYLDANRRVESHDGDEYAGKAANINERTLSRRRRSEAQRSRGCEGGDVYEDTDTV